MRVGIIRVLTTSDPVVLESHAKILQACGLETITECIPDQYSGIHDDESERIAIPKILHLAKQMEHEVDALFVSCAADPGVTQLRDIVNIPVIGAGSACAAVARAIGDKVGVISIVPEVPPSMENVLGMSVWAFHQPAGVETTLDLMTEAGRKSAIRAAMDLKQKGCNVLALACTGFSTIGLAGELMREVGLYTVDPVRAAGHVLKFILSARSV